MIKFDARITIDDKVTNAPNLCDRLSDRDKEKISRLVVEGYTKDLSSRSPWQRRNQAGMDLAMQVQKEKTFPWPGAANVVFPLVTIAALQFSARAYSAIVQGTEICQYRVVGDDPDGSLKLIADRISRHMSWQVLEQDTAWEEQHDRLLLNVSIVGTTFIKTYYSPSLRHNVSDLVLAQDLVLDYYARSVEKCSRKTEHLRLSRNEIWEKCAAKTFVDIREEAWFQVAPAQVATSASASQDNRTGTTPPQSDSDTPFLFLEQHRYLDLDGDGYLEPYVCTVEFNSRTLVRVVARWDSLDQVSFEDGKIRCIRPTEYYTKYGFIPSPDGSIYDIGFGTLLGPINESVNTGINQLLDAGTMQNSLGGFLGRGAKIRGGVYTMAPWEWKRVDSTGDDLRKNLVPFPDRQPSTVLFQLLNLLIQYSDRLASTTDQMVGVTPGQNTPAETSRNTMESGLQAYSMIFTRIWRSMKGEFQKLHELNKLFLPAKETFGNSSSTGLRQDYSGSSDLIVPAADPRLSSVGMKVMQATAIKEASMTKGGYDKDEVERNYLRALGCKDIDKIYPGEAKMPPPGPSEKIQIQQMKMQAQSEDLQFEKWKFITQLMEDRRKIEAEIAKLEAEALFITAETDSVKAAKWIQGFDSVINTLKARSDSITNRLKVLQSSNSEGDSSATVNDQSGGVRGLAGPSSNEGVPRPTPIVPDGPNGAVGTREFSGNIG